MTLYTKSILREREPNDGLRISVMSRHTLADGITSDERIHPDLFDEHLPILAPHPRLIGDYYKRGLPWEEFQQRFLLQIRDERTQVVLRRIVHRAINTNITLLCIESSPERCYRRLLAEECQNTGPQLTVVIC